MWTAARFIIALAAGLALTAAAVTLRPDSARTLTGPEVPVGNGSARMFVDLGPGGEPRTLGIALTEGALSGLATRMNTTSRCFDKNRDGTVAHGECLGDYQSELELPAGAADLGLPFRWATVNWNPEGHMPPAPPVWSAPHFDFHFFTAERALIQGIRTGPCAEFIHCEDSARASTPLAARYLPADYADVGAAVAAMGNHLVDLSDPELADPSLGFSRTFIYGAYDGKLIFLEPMVSHAFLSSRPDRCTPLRVPAAYAMAGYYPTAYCVRHDAAAATYRVTLEGLVYRKAG
jgi:hypothetical protein